jgi:hypothetical protein
MSKALDSELQCLKRSGLPDNTLNRVDLGRRFKWQNI